jgi:DNA end-binding protein Ku
MRAIWKGHISFALVSIPVSVISGSRTSDVSFKYLHREDLSPVSYRRFCDREGVEVGWDEITRGYEFEKGRFVEVTPEEIRAANARLTRTIQILEFVDLAEIDPVYFEKPYYLEPGAGGEHAYSLFAQALQDSGRVGIARVVLKTREHLTAIRPSGRLMTMQTLRFAHEVVEPGSVSLPAEPRLSPKELDLARTLIDTMSDSFDAGRYKDEYREELLGMIQRKVAGEETTPGAPVQAPGQVVDLMEVLRKSLQGRREKSVPVRETPVRETPVGETPVRETTVAPRPGRARKKRTEASPKSKSRSKSKTTPTRKSG